MRFDHWSIALSTNAADQKQKAFHAVAVSGISQLVTWSSRHTVKSCDKLTVMSDGVEHCLWVLYLTGVQIQKIMTGMAFLYARL